MSAILSKNRRRGTLNVIKKIGVFEDKRESDADSPLIRIDKQNKVTGIAHR